MQALTLLNDQAYVEMAQALAARVLQLDGLRDEEQRLKLAFRMCVARTPRASEVAVLRELLAEERERLAQTPGDVETLTKNVRLSQGSEPPENKLEWAAWTCVANALLNLDETISKE